MILPYFQYPMAQSRHSHSKTEKQRQNKENLDQGKNEKQQGKHQMQQLPVQCQCDVTISVPTTLGSFIPPDLWSTAHVDSPLGWLYLVSVAFLSKYLCSSISECLEISSAA